MINTAAAVFQDVYDSSQLCCLSPRCIKIVFKLDLSVAYGNQANTEEFMRLADLI